MGAEPSKEQVVKRFPSGPAGESAENAVELVECEGYLFKQSQDLFKRWRMRWFRQRGYHAPKDASPSGFILITNIKSVRKVSEVGFVVSTAERDLSLIAPNRRECSWWVDSLKRWMAFYATRQGAGPQRGSDLLFARAGLQRAASGAHDNPEFWLHTLRLDPSVGNLASLEAALRGRGLAWMTAFVDEDGIAAVMSVFLARDVLVTKTVLDAGVQEGCLRCVRSLTANRVGIDAVVASSNRSALRPLALAIASRTVPMACAAVELLTAVCVYSPEGYRRVSDAMEHLRATHREPARFRRLVRSLVAVDDFDYKAAVLSFLKALVAAAGGGEAGAALRADLARAGAPEAVRRLRVRECPELRFPLKAFEEIAGAGEDPAAAAAGVQGAGEEDAEELSDVDDPPASLPTLVDFCRSVEAQIATSEQRESFLSVLHLLATAGLDSRVGPALWGHVDAFLRSGAAPAPGPLPPPHGSRPASPRPPAGPGGASGAGVLPSPLAGAGSLAPAKSKGAPEEEGGQPSPPSNSPLLELPRGLSGKAPPPALHAAAAEVGRAASAGKLLAGVTAQPYPKKEGPALPAPSARRAASVF
eukprot:tig00000241_g20984.t1